METKLFKTILMAGIALSVSVVGTYAAPLIPGDTISLSLSDFVSGGNPVSGSAFSFYSEGATAKLDTFTTSFTPTGAPGGLGTVTGFSLGSPAGDVPFIGYVSSATPYAGFAQNSIVLNPDTDGLEIVFTAKQNGVYSFASSLLVSSAISSSGSPGVYFSIEDSVGNSLALTGSSSPVNKGATAAFSTAQNIYLGAGQFVYLDIQKKGGVNGSTYPTQVTSLVATYVAVPEPSTWVGLAAALGGLGLLARSRKSSSEGTEAAV